MFRLPPTPSLAMMMAGWLVCALGLPAQDQAPANPPAQATTLRSVREVEAMSLKDIENQPREVRVTGVVTFVGLKQQDIKIQDEERGIGVSLPEGAACPQIGDRVEVEGRTGLIQVQEHVYRQIRAAKVTPRGQGSLPKPMQASVGDLIKFNHYNQWVAVEGRVLMWTLKEPTLTLMLAGPESWAVVHVRGWMADRFPKNLHGARVRVTGVNMGISHSAADTLMAPGPAQLEVLEPGLENIFDAPEVTLAGLKTTPPPAGVRAKLKGVVTARTDERVLYIRQGTEAASAGLLYGWLRSTSNVQLYADNGRLPTLKPGDEVELVGTVVPPDARGAVEAYTLAWCHVRITGQQPPPGPVETSLATVAGGNSTFDWVRLKARLLQKQTAPVSRGLWRTSMMLEHRGVQLPAVYEGTAQDALAALQVDHDLELSALVDKATSRSPRQLWIVSPGDVRSLGLAGTVREERLWLWGGSAAGGLVVLGLWVFTLQRAVRRRASVETALHELNTRLEQSVAERTQELEKTQQNLRKALDHERDLGELKSRFVTMVSHEFRTPLGIIMSAIELMRHYDERLPHDQRRELYEDIYTSTRLMGGLMEQVLVLGRVEAGKLGCRPVVLDLDQLAEKLTDESVSVTNRRCPIEWKSRGDLQGACVDEALFRHIFGNLITNAVKYSPEGSTVEFAARREGIDAIFTVRDHGIGIPADDKAKLFEAFHRCSNVGDIPGTGLGLVIVKRCVELHGGTLAVQSEVGQGTTFTVRLPLFLEATSTRLSRTAHA